MLSLIIRDTITRDIIMVTTTRAIIRVIIADIKIILYTFHLFNSHFICICFEEVFVEMCGLGEWKYSDSCE